MAAILACAAAAAWLPALFIKKPAARAAVMSAVDLLALGVLVYSGSNPAAAAAFTAVCAAANTAAFILPPAETLKKPGVSGYVFIAFNLCAAAAAGFVAVRDGAMPAPAAGMAAPAAAFMFMAAAVAGFFAAGGEK